jgi:hypothetical protein
VTKSRSEDQRAYRRRKRAGEMRLTVLMSKLIRKAFIEQAVRVGTPRHEAEEEVRDREWVTQLSQDVLDQWAQDLLSGRYRHYHR